MAGGMSFGRKRNQMQRHSTERGRGVEIPLETIKQGHRMDPRERIFLDAVEKGDKPTVMRCLSGVEPVSVNCTDMLGRSAIQIAVDNENSEIVELLLRQEGVQIGDALLYAIREGVYRIVEMLIEHPSISRDMLGSDWARRRHVTDESYDYSPDISPVILAAHCNQFEILQLLLLHGATIDRPHQLSCSCKRCQAKVHADSLRHSLLRINTYKALASPAWISLTSPDPVLTAFTLSRELDRLALRENEFKDSYIQLSQQCKKYACDLLDQCRSSDEVIAVLNKTSDVDEDADKNGQGDKENKLTLARLKLALKYEQKQFVSHPNCQQLLTSIWYEGLPGWRKRNSFTKFLICIGLIVLLPFIAIYYLTFPRSKIGQLLRSPFMKFLYHSASFGVFLFLLACASTDIINVSQKRERFRGPKPSELEWMIVLWVTGFVWAECKQLWDEGLKAYLRQWWNWLDFIMLSLYLCTFSLRVVAYFQIESGNYGQREMRRADWPENDPTLISEGLFAVANVFSFARIIYLFQANQQLGPLQISLGCMLIDIAKFLLIFFLVLSSFACGLNQLYWYYSDSHSHQEDMFFSLFSSYVTLFWSMFSLTPPSRLEIKSTQSFTQTIGELLFMAYHAMIIIVLLNMLIAMMSSSFQEIENHADMEWKFARSKLWMGYFDEGATLPSPFNLIISPKSMYYFYTWCRRCVCGCVYRDKSRYDVGSQGRRSSAESTIRSRHTVGPTNGTIFKVWRPERLMAVKGLKFEGKYSRKVSHERQPGSVSSQSLGTKHSGDGFCTGNERPTYNGYIQSFDPQMMTSREETQRYQEVMRRLICRYIHQTKKQLRQDGVNEDDLLEIKQDISSLRFELREDRKCEVVRTTSHMDNLRRDLHHTISSISPLPQNISSFPGSPPNLSPARRSGGDARMADTGNELLVPPGQRLDIIMPPCLSVENTLPPELELLKAELIASFRQELRESMRGMLSTSFSQPTCSSASPSPQPTISLPTDSSDLYHTHLYTQL